MRGYFLIDIYKPKPENLTSSFLILKTTSLISTVIKTEKKFHKIIILNLE